MHDATTSVQQMVPLGSHWLRCHDVRVRVFPFSRRTEAKRLVLVIFAAGLVAGTSVALATGLFRLHAAFALAGAALGALVLTAVVIHEATRIDGVPPTQYDEAVIAIGASLGSLIPACFLSLIRWLNRRVSEARLLRAATEEFGEPPRRPH